MLYLRYGKYYTGALELKKKVRRNRLKTTFRYREISLGLLNFQHENNNALEKRLLCIFWYKELKRTTRLIKKLSKPVYKVKRKINVDYRHFFFYFLYQTYIVASIRISSTRRF